MADYHLGPDYAGPAQQLQQQRKLVTAQVTVVTRSPKAGAQPGPGNACSFYGGPD